MYLHLYRTEQAGGKPQLQNLTCRRRTGGWETTGTVSFRFRIFCFGSHFFTLLNRSKNSSAPWTGIAVQCIRISGRCKLGKTCIKVLLRILHLCYDQSDRVWRRRNCFYHREEGHLSRIQSRKMPAASISRNSDFAFSVQQAVRWSWDCRLQDRHVSKYNEIWLSLIFSIFIWSHPYVLWY